MGFDFDGKWSLILTHRQTNATAAAGNSAGRAPGAVAVVLVVVL